MQKLERLSAKELIAELQKAPPDAFVIIHTCDIEPKHTQADMIMIDGIEVQEAAVVRLILSEPGYW